MVIQRWQSVLLLVAAAVMTVFTFSSLGQVQGADFTYNMRTLGLYIEGEPVQGAPSGLFIHTWYFFALSLLSAIVALLSIFMFKNTGLQKRLCLINILFMVALYAIGAVIGYTAIPDSTIGWSTAVICPLLGIISTIMAYNRISSDVRKIRSADRIR